MKRRVVAGVLLWAAIGVGGYAVAAGAEPADQSPIGGTGAHVHHIHTGDGGCHDLDQHLFEPRQIDEARHRGLHEGALQGRVHHGFCAGTSHS